MNADGLGYLNQNHDIITHITDIQQNKISFVRQWLYDKILNNETMIRIRGWGALEKQRSK